MNSDDLQPSVEDVTPWGALNNDGGLNGISWDKAPLGSPTRSQGWPKINSTPLAKKGQPIKRADLNGMGNYLDHRIIILMIGFVPDWQGAIARAIDGYPKNAEVMLGGSKYRSLQNKNLDNPVGSPKWRQLD